jgi:O-antigen/teichoic acid export membrane protein
VSTSRPLRERIVFRYGATLIANLLRAALSFLSGILIARGLGASGYGDLNFLLASFAAISQLLDVGTSSAFYTFISQRRRSRNFALLYTGWMLAQFAVTALVVGLLLPSNLIQRIWVGHQRGIVLLAFGSSFMMTQLWGMVSALGEATRKTVFIQLTAVGQAVVHLALVAILIHWGWLTVSFVLWLLVGEYLLLAIFLGPRLWRWNLTEQSARNEASGAIFREFAAYCAPLVFYGWASFLYTFADRWLLQKFGGSEQQGFFAVGQQVAAISLIATTSILRVFWKEVAEARERQDHQRVQKLYVSVARSLYFAGAGLSCLFIPYSRQILAWTVGISYEGAWLCLALMFLFPIHQSLGQIQGALFYASSETKTYARIGYLMMGVSIPVTYFVLAPRSAAIAGLGLGAAGLAVKMVVLQIGGVSLQSYVIAKTNGWSYDYSYQAIVLATLLGLGWACKWAAGALLGMSGAAAGPVEVILLGSSFYAAGLLILLYCRPELAGLTRGEARHMVSHTARWLRSTVA